MDLLLTTLLLLLVVAVPCLTQLPSQDILSLLAFKKGITHDPTGCISASWNEESIDFNGCPSSWNGIVCSGGSVAGVVLDNLDLSGNADLSVFTNLTMLLKLSISGNNLSGVLPGNVAGFTKLKHLDVSGNSFSGELPEDIGKLVSLQNLTLAANTFNGSIPVSLLKLKNLVNLNLSRNAFTGDIPTGLEEMGQLESIDLSGNQLDGGVHWEFLTQSSVVHVDLSGNLLTSAGPKEMKFLSEVSETVRYLNLSRNRLTGQLIDAPEISTFGSLKVLDLSCNQLTGELPRFDYVYDLEVLRLGDNGFSGAVPNVLLKGDSLVLSELDLSSNNLSGHIGFISSTTLRTVNLSSNAISGGLPLLTGSCITLDLSRNQFTGNLSVIAKWENDIEYVDLSQNQLTGPVPEVTSEFLQLSHLNLSHNLLTSTLPQVFVQYQKLTVLDLSFNQFGGPIATDWLTSPTLQELYLQNNLLEGSIVLLPLTKKSSLQILNLSRNRINGSFPTDLGPLTGLQMLDVSENNFSGVLPQGLAKLTALTLLDISLNHFTGPLPSTMSDTLVMFNASYNDLSGVVPDYLREFPSSSFYPGNSRLQFPNSPSGSENAPSGGSSHKPSPAFVKAAIIAACIVALASLFLLAIFIHYKKISQRSRSDKVTDRNVQKKPLSGTAGVRGRDSSGALVVNADELICPLKGLPSEMISQEEKMTVMSSYSPSKNSRFSWSPDCSQDFGRLDVRTPDRLVGDLYFLDETITLTPEELSRAAAEILGRSSRGTSYKATLDNGVFLTVKWLREGVAKQKKEFAKEAKKFTNIRHPNVVGLRGYYWGPTQHEKLILTDYVSPGSLASFLYDRPGRQGPPLTWAQRLKIAVDVARGLNYLHFDRAFPHGNLKATNILLDGLDLNARVSDYCLHRLMTQSGATEQILDSGVLGYRAPELTASKKPIPSFKSDVYAFGILLLELLSGRCAADVVSVEEGGVDLTEWVRMNVAEGGGDDCFDGDMAQDILNPEAAKGMKEMLGIALRCIRPVSERPGIKSVYEDLSSI